MSKFSRISLLSQEDQQLLGRIDEASISSKVWQHAERPRHEGILKDPDGHAKVTGICEDTVVFQVRLKETIIDDIRFHADGCGFTVACASMASEWVLGKGVGEALCMTGKQIETALGAGTRVSFRVPKYTPRLHQ